MRTADWVRCERRVGGCGFDPTENKLRLIAVAFLALLSLPALAPAADLWITDAEIAPLPTSGPAWDNVKSAADNATDSPNLQNLTNNHDVETLAQALVAVRLGLNGAGAGYRAAAADKIMSIIGTEGGTSELPIARNTTSYVIAADLIDFKTFRPTSELVFRRWLVDLRYRCFGPYSFYSSSEKRPNNWGTMSSAARLAIALYARKYGVPAGACVSFGSCNLPDAPLYCSNPNADVTRVATVWKGYLGDRSSYAGFVYGDLSWQFDASRPVGINPVGASKLGHDIDGVLPDDQRRSGSFSWPPVKASYVYEALQGAVVTTELLSRAGYDAWSWQDNALLRAFEWLHATQFSDGQGYPAGGDDEWQPHVINFRYHTSFPAPVPARPGKLMGWTDWTHTARPLIAGKTLVLKDNSNPLNHRLSVQSVDPAISLGAGNGSADDPVVATAGSTLRVRTASGCNGPCDTTYPLAGEWSYIAQSGDNKGYRYKDRSGPITSVMIKPGRILSVKGKGALGHSLSVDPKPVDVVLRIGEKRFCMRFGGVAVFTLGRSFKAAGAVAPSACPE